MLEKFHFGLGQNPKFRYEANYALVLLKMPARQRSYFVGCPFCHGTMEVEAASGRILGKWEKEDKNKPPEERFRMILEKEKESKKRLAGYFQGAQSEMEEKKKKAEELFKEGLKKIQHKL